MKEIFLVLIGGICSMLGGCITIWYQAKKARKIRMEELRGEQQLEACKRGLSLIQQVRTRYMQFEPKDVTKFLEDNHEWFSDNQVLLPHVFVENWISIQNNIRCEQRCNENISKTNDMSERNRIVAEKTKLQDLVKKLIGEADKVIRNELGLKEVKIKRPE
jgi:hypothetical protein